MNEKENLIKEQRLIEATRKNLTGLEGKLGVILKYLGEPVIAEGSSCYEAYPLADMYELPNDDDMPTADMDTAKSELGQICSCLKWGVNMEIMYLKFSKVPFKVNEYYTKWIEKEKVLSVTYKGYVVYREIEGDLNCYLPDDEWEFHIDRIYESCKKIRKDVKKDFDEMRKEENKKDKLNFLARLRETWGI
jgi:hypothetical protein